MAALNYYPRWQQVLALEMEGNRLLAARQLEAAKLQFEQAKQIEPADSRPHESLAGLYVAEGSWAEAVVEYRQDLRVATDRRRTLVALAAAYIGTGDATRAAQTITEAVGHRQNAIEHEAVAELLEAHKLYAQAVQEHEVASRLHPDWPLALNNLAWLYATSEDARFRMPLEAERLAQRPWISRDGESRIISIHWRRLTSLGATRWPPSPPSAWRSSSPRNGATSSNTLPGLRRRCTTKNLLV
jgi:tetratricopeptide (TPR) repeat protein